MSKNNITIVGGGTAGLVTALILQTRLNSNLTIIKSDKIGIIGVGEGSTEHWEDFMEVCQLSLWEMLKETDATLKLGIYFKNWSDKPYYHHVGNFNAIKLGQYPVAVGLNYVKGVDQVMNTDYHNIENKVEYLKDKSPSRQFHFNTYKLNEYLIKKCKERNINIIDDEITDVTINNEGIDTLIGKKQNYKSDFYIDCTGFKRLLISKLGAKWQSYSKYLKLNEAIAFPTGDTDEYTPFTTATAMSSGWMWRIPVFGRHGNGYIYDNNFMNAEQAKLEAEKHLGHEIEIAKNIKFEPGALDKPWIGNCMATGLAANFVEPLEASSIATTINQAFVFVNHYFPGNDVEVNKFNIKMNKIMENIRDFIAVHYVVNRNDTDFWKSMKSVELPDTLKEKLDAWKYRLVKQDDFNSPDYLLFREDNFNQVLYGLQYFDKNSIEKELMTYRPEIIEYCAGQLREWNNNKSNEILEFKYISHKKWLEKARNVA